LIHLLHQQVVAIHSTVTHHKQDKLVGQEAEALGVQVDKDQVDLVTLLQQLLLKEVMVDRQQHLIDQVAAVVLLKME
jgi:hypothetical protein